ncbi:MAG TPA: beta-propeller fold lactonase family protein [Steroidobacteraceae bacterium]
MNEQTRRDARHLLAPVVLGVLLGGFAGCGGSGTVAANGGGVPGTGYAYVVSQEVPGELHPGAVYQFAIGADGSLAPLAAASVPTGTRPVSIASDPGGHYVYVVNGGDATISQYRVGSGGLLSPLVPGSISISGAILGGTAFTGITVDPSGRLVYVVERALDPAPSAMIAQYSIGSDGALTPLTTPVQLVEAFAGPLVIHPNGQFAYLSGITAVPNTSVSQYSRDASGTLTPLVPPTPSGTTDAVGVYVVPSGQTVYVLRACIDVQCDGQIVQYTVGADGTLTSTGNAAITGGHFNPVAMLTDESGSNAYLLANFMGVDTNQGTVIQYSINSQGVLAPGSPPSVPVTSGAVALASIGPHLYALSSHAIGQASGSPSGGNIDHFIVGSSGALNMAGTTALLGSFPVAMTVVSGH